MERGLPDYWEKMLAPGVSVQRYPNTDLEIGFQSNYLIEAGNGCLELSVLFFDKGGARIKLEYQSLYHLPHLKHLDRLATKELPKMLIENDLDRQNCIDRMTAVVCTQSSAIIFHKKDLEDYLDELMYETKDEEITKIFYEIPLPEPSEFDIENNKIDKKTQQDINFCVYYYYDQEVGTCCAELPYQYFGLITPGLIQALINKKITGERNNEQIFTNYSDTVQIICDYLNL